MLSSGNGLSESRRLLQQLSMEMAGLVDHVQERLVQIRDGSNGIGAGTIWRPEGLIVTNAHVAHRNSMEVTLFNNETLPAQVIARDVQRDLAVLVVEANGLPSIELGDSRSLEAGQWVMALGHPWGQVGAATAGVVIGHGASPDEREWLVADLRLRPGHSGGPMVDIHGRLMGINTMMNGPDVGIAIPVHVAKAFLYQALSA